MTATDDLFISDLHLDADTPQRQATFLAMLARHAVPGRRLFILGDLFNVWIGRKHLAEPWVGEVARALRRATDAGAEIHFVAGNRDFYGMGSLAERTGMTTHKTGFAIDSRGCRVWLCHGHSLYRDDTRTHTAQAVTHSRPVEWLFERLPSGLAHFLAQGYRHHSGRVVHHKTRRMLTVSDGAVRRLAADGIEAIVFGHSHRLSHQVWRIDGRDIRLLNLGCWNDHPHFLRHGEDGWHFHRVERE